MWRKRARAQLKATLSNGADMGIQGLSINALVQVFKLYGSSKAVMEKLMTHQDALTNNGLMGWGSFVFGIPSIGLSSGWSVP